MVRGGVGSMAGITIKATISCFIHSPSPQNAPCCSLVTLAILSSSAHRIQLLLENSVTREDGQLIMPTRYDPDGWCYDPPVGPSNDDILPKRGVYTGPIPWRMQELAHLYHASMSDEDYELITRIRDGEVERDWNEIGDRGGEKNGGETEFARFQYYDGLNPDWPEKILSAEYRWAVEAFDKIRLDNRTVEEIVTTNYFPPNPVFTKGLTQVTMGAPQSVYNGGLLRATVRYYDRDNARPGLPKDVAALVDKLGSDAVGIQLVNLSTTETRNAIVQAGAFGEHQFTGLKYREMSQEELHQNPYLWLRSDREYAEKETSVNGKYFAVELPPSTSVRLEVGMRRFVNDPSYAFPWH